MRRTSPEGARTSARGEAALGALALALSVCLAPGCATGSFDSPYVASNFQSARSTPAIPVGDTAEFAYSGGEAWFRLALDQGGLYQVDTEGSAFDTVLALYDAQQSVVERDDDGGAGLTSSIERELSAGDWFVLLTGFQGKSGEAHLSLNLLSPGATGAGARRISVGGTQSGQLRAGARVEFLLTVAQPGRYELTTAGSSCDTVLELFDASNARIERDDDSGPSTTSLITRNLNAGEYRMEVSGFSSTTTGSVRCRVRLIQAQSGSLTQGTAPRSTERGSTRFLAIPLTLGSASSATLSANEELWFSVRLERSGTWNFTTEGSGFDTLLSLHDNSGQQLASDDDGGPGTSSFVSRELGAGIWFLRLSGFGQSGGSARMLARAASAPAPPAPSPTSTGRVSTLRLGSTARGQLAAGLTRYAEGAAQLIDTYKEVGSVTEGQ